MLNLNYVSIVGRLGSDLDVKTTNNSSWARFSVAVSRYNGKGKDYTTDWVPCVVFGQNAQYLAQHAHKGDIVLVTGDLHSSSYKDKQGQTRTSLDVTVRNASVMPKAQTQSQQPAQAPTNQVPYGAPQSAPQAPANQQVPYGAPAPQQPVAPQQPIADWGPNDDLPF